MSRDRTTPPRLPAITGLMLCIALASTPTLGSPSPAPTMEQLNNLTYKGITEQPIRLKDGVCEGAPAAPGAPLQPRVLLLDGSRVTGDLDGDGIDDAAVLLAASSGGGGESLYLAVVRGAKNEEEIRNLATQLIGNRVRVRAFRIDQGKLVLDLVKAGAGDAACCPSLKVRTGFRLENEALVESGREEQGRLSIADLPGTTWSLIQLGSKQSLPSGVAVTIEFEGDQVSGSAGCNRYFAGIKGNGPYDISIGSPGATRRACPEPVMAVETLYLNALQKVSQFEFRAGRLVLTYNPGENQPLESLIFSADK